MSLRFVVLYETTSYVFIFLRIFFITFTICFLAFTCFFFVFNFMSSSNVVFLQHFIFEYSFFISLIIFDFNDLEKHLLLCLVGNKDVEIIVCKKIKRKNIILFIIPSFFLFASCHLAFAWRAARRASWNLRSFHNHNRIIVITSIRHYHK